MNDLVKIKSAERYYINPKGEVLDSDSGKFLTISTHTGASGKQYRVFNMLVDGKRKQYYLHRVLAETFIPNPDNLPQVDHRDGDGLNNSLDNIRWATVSKNMQNRKVIAHTSQYMGVSWDTSRQRWAANVHVANKKKQLGRFHDEVEAAKAYDAAAKEAGFEHVNF